MWNSPEGLLMKPCAEYACVFYPFWVPLLFPFVRWCNWGSWVVINSLQIWRSRESNPDSEQIQAAVIEPRVLWRADSPHWQWFRFCPIQNRFLYFEPKAQALPRPLHSLTLVVSVADPTLGKCMSLNNSNHHGAPTIKNISKQSSSHGNVSDFPLRAVTW